MLALFSKPHGARSKSMAFISIQKIARQLGYGRPVSKLISWKFIWPIDLSVRINPISRMRKGVKG
jgi:hypothetical protein